MKFFFIIYFAQKALVFLIFAKVINKTGVYFFIQLFNTSLAAFLLSLSGKTKGI
jgi:hypothetical protein